MLVSRRCYQDPELGAAHEVHAILRSDLRLHVVQLRHLVVDDELLVPAFPRVGAVGRPLVAVVLRGRARFKASGRVEWLEAGNLAFVPSKSDLRVRQEGDEYQALVVEWDPGAMGDGIGSFQTGRLSEADLGRLRAAADAIRNEGVEPAARAHATLVLLRGLGVPVRATDPACLDEPVPARLAALGRTLDSALSCMSDRPMLVDLEARVGLGQRQVNRLVLQLNQRYGLNAGNWRDTVFRRRVMLGAALMSVPGARTERVARRVGFGSATAFCHALGRSALPAPASIRERLQQLS